MDRRLKIAIISTIRSDRGLLEPVAVEAGSRGHRTDFYGGEGLTNPGDYDWCLCCFDRPEMAYLAHKTFLAGGRIAQMAAGDIRVGGGDERHRWAISAYASLLLPWTLAAEGRCMYFRDIMGLGTRIRRMAPTTWDHIKPIQPKCVPPDCNLVLFNPPFKKHDLQYVLDRVAGSPTCWLPPNQGELPADIPCIGSLSHAEFLGALQVCGRFITNSSSSWYAAPKVLPEDRITRIGLRNQYADLVEFWDDNRASSVAVNALEDCRDA